MGFHHVVLFRWHPDTSVDQVRAIADALGALPKSIPEVSRFRFGADAGLAPGNWDFAVAAEFADRRAFEVYRDHPAHTALIADHIAPVVAERLAVQFSST